MSSPCNMKSPPSISAIIADARRHLELEQAFDIYGIPVDADRIAGFSRSMTASAATARQRALDALCEQLQPCNRCGLGDTRKNLVFGAGNANADLMLVGEAPGQYEDEQGIPFVGPAGKLLTKIIRAIGLTRDKVYIANILKCRPPRNRTPSNDESSACFPHLLQQIEIIQPSIIVTLGNPATKAILQTTQGITRMRGKFVAWNGIEVMPTFHPSYLLRSPSAKRQVWQDMQKVHARMKELGLPIGDLQQGRRRA